MSSSYSREPLTGTIRQQGKIIGGIVLPEKDPHEFIEEFNRCYGPLNLHIDLPAFIPKLARSVLPVGAKRPQASDSPDTDGSATLSRGTNYPKSQG